MLRDHCESGGDSPGRSLTDLFVLGIDDADCHWADVIAAIDAASEAAGRKPDVVLQVGDAEPLRNEDDLAGTHVPSKYRSLGDFSLLEPGDMKAPVYFIAGNLDPYPELDAAAGTHPLEWGNGTNVHYLGRAGAAVLSCGLHVARLSGIYSPTANAKTRPTSPKARSYFLPDGVCAVVTAARQFERLDVLLTNDWPSGITPHDPDVGTASTSELVERIQPRLSLHGHHHRAFETSIARRRSVV